MPKFPENTEMRTSKAFSERLKELMDDNDCATNMQFAKLVDVSFSVILKAVNFGIIPTMKILLRIADKLGVSLSFLLAITDENDFIEITSPSSFHIRIKELAEERKETLGSIASKMPFAKSYFYEWIKYETFPSLEYAIAIAEYFDVSLDYLFGRTDFRN